MFFIVWGIYNYGIIKMFLFDSNNIWWDIRLFVFVDSYKKILFINIFYVVVKIEFNFS